MRQTIHSALTPRGHGLPPRVSTSPKLPAEIIALENTRGKIMEGHCRLPHYGGRRTRLPEGVKIKFLFLKNAGEVLILYQLKNNKLFTFGRKISGRCIKFAGHLLKIRFEQVGKEKFVRLVRSNNGSTETV